MSAFGSDHKQYRCSFLYYHNFFFVMRNIRLREEQKGLNVNGRLLSACYNFVDQTSVLQLGRLQSHA
jgi:hypothetical protein